MGPSSTPPQSAGSAKTPMSEQQPKPEVDQAAASWTWLVEAAAGVLLLVGTGVALHYYAPAANNNNDLQNQVTALNQQVELLKQEQAMPVMVLNRYRNSICYVFGIYHVGFANQPPSLRARVSGTGFVVASGLLATNRHVAEPWYGDPEADTLIHRGATATLEKLVAFFPGSPTPFDIVPTVVSAHSDLAVLHLEFTPLTRALAPLPLSKTPTAPGELVTVIGYPMGVAGMVAKSPTEVYERLAYRHDDINAASELAALSLIRPSATVGHLGDAIGDKLIYDAPTAHGGSGGPVFNASGQVIGINSAYIDGFSGGTLGISVEALRPLIAAAEKRTPASDMHVGEARTKK
jgi:S1-C subfamily serine protease